MRRQLVELLRCPHCGDVLELGDACSRGSDEVHRGVLHDRCAAYPIVAGIPYVRADNVGRRALEALGKGDDDGALKVLLAVGAGDPLPLEDGLSFREAVALLVPGSEAFQLFHRFSDPVFRASDHLMRALAIAERPSGPVLDFGGGAGHLTRSLVSVVEDAVVLADVSFGKLWLATQFVVPLADAVCCDGNTVLPFAPTTFALVTTSDAFHYIWSRQLVASELLRVRAHDGVLVMAHLHNALADNHSPGMPLEPAGYRRVLGPQVRLMAEGPFLDAALTEVAVDLRDRADDELAACAALTAVVPGCPLPDELAPAPVIPGGPLAMNPMYRLHQRERWVLEPPSLEYVEEYADMLRYLPRTVTVSADLIERAGRGEDQADVAALRRSRVLLDLPDRYL